MHRILKVAQREYAETVKTKTFIMSVLMTPVLMGLIIFFSSRLAHDVTGPRPPRNVAFTDRTNELSAEIKASFDAYNTSHPQRVIRLDEIQADEAGCDAAANEQKNRVRDGGLDAYVILDQNVVKGSGEIRAYTRSTKAPVLDLVSTIGSLLNQAVVNRRCKLRNLDPELLAELRRHVPTQRVEVGPAADEERTRKKGEQIVGMMVPFFFMFLMFMGIFGMGQHILSSVIEEKSSRVIEMLLSAISPFQLMAGKILGLAGIGLTVICLWGGAALVAARWRGVSFDVTGEMLLCFAVYYVLGFLLFTSILAGIGSICNTMKEAQSLMMPFTLLVVVPMVAWFNLAQHPDGMLARILSFVPLLTPMVMILRLSASPDLPLIEILASVVVLGVSVPVVVWAAARVFRTGILMYGKRPKLGEVLRWLGQS